MNKFRVCEGLKHILTPLSSFPADEDEQQAYSLAAYGLVSPDFPHPQTAVGMDELDGMATAYSPYPLLPQNPGGSGMEQLEGGSSALSPQQYAMLMTSMQDPLAMYSTSLPGQDRAPANQFDPLEMYGGQPYNISPTYSGGVVGGRGQDEEGPAGEDSHPVFTMMSSTYPPKAPLAHQPRPPTTARPPTAPKKSQNRPR